MRRGPKPRKRPVPVPPDPTLPDPQALRRRRLGLLFWRHREAARLSRHELGAAVGLTDAEVRKIEAGRFALTQELWDRICGALPKLAAVVAHTGIAVDPSTEGKGGTES